MQQRKIKIMNLHKLQLSKENYKKRFIWKNKLAAFTLVEVILAMAITTMGLLLISGFILLEQKNTSVNANSDQIQWNQMLEMVTGDQLQLTYQGQDVFKKDLFYSQTQEKTYIFTYNNQKVYLQDNVSGGYMPLLYEVSQWNLSYQEPYLKVTATMHGIKYQEKIYLTKREE